MSPSEVGERAEVAVLAALAHSGRRVLIPFSPSQRYDLVFEEDGMFYRVQCKAGRERNGVIIFMTCSRTGNVSKEYRDEVDFFGVYCHERDEVYLVPVGEVPLRAGRLRLEPTRNAQRKGIRWAQDFLLREDLISYDLRPPRDARPPPTRGRTMRRRLLVTGILLLLTVGGCDTEDTGGELTPDDRTEAPQIEITDSPS